MNSKYYLIAELSSIAIVGGVVFYLIFKVVSTAENLVKGFESGTISPQEGYLIAVSNPITQYATSQSLKSQISKTYPEYANANVIYVQNASTVNTALLTQPTIIVSPSGISTYNPLPSGAPTGYQLGGAGNPYDFNLGWQGQGFYWNIPSLFSNSVVVFIPNEYDYNLEKTKGGITAF